MDDAAPVGRTPVDPVTSAMTEGMTEGLPGITLEGLASVDGGIADVGTLVVTGSPDERTDVWTEGGLPVFEVGAPLAVALVMESPTLAGALPRPLTMDEIGTGNGRTWDDEDEPDDEIDGPLDAPDAGSEVDAPDGGDAVDGPDGAEAVDERGCELPDTKGADVERPLDEPCEEGAPDVVSEPVLPCEDDPGLDNLCEEESTDVVLSPAPL